MYFSGGVSHDALLSSNAIPKLKSYHLKPLDPNHFGLLSSSHFCPK